MKVLAGHFTISPLFFIAYPQTQVPAPSVLGPCAVTAVARSSIHYPTALNPPRPLGSRTLTQYLQIPNFYAPECPLLTLPSSTSRRPRRDMPQLEPKYNLKATIPSNMLDYATRGSAGLSSSEEPGALRPLRALRFSLLRRSLWVSSLYILHAPQLPHAWQPTRAPHIYVSSPSPCCFRVTPM